MKTILQTALTAALLLLVPNVNFGQAPNLGTTSTFALFTASGAINNTGVSLITGDVGTNAGAFNGFPPGVIVGEIHVADPESAQAATDVQIAYNDLAALPCGLVLGTNLGNNQVLGPNVYCLGAASTLNGDLILDGQGDADALFIFQINGALSTGVLSNVILTNAASLCNVYWQVNGAVSLGDNSIFRGTIIAGGALNFLESATLLGRGLSTAGAINLNTNVVSVVLGMAPIASVITALGPTTFCEGGSVVLTGNVDGTWNTGETTTSITVTTSGSYFVTNTNDCGSVNSNIIIVTVNPLPICTITGNDIICEGQTTQLCAPEGLSGYLWSTGETTGCITVGIAGIYSVVITDANGCSSTCDTTVSANPLPICTIAGDDVICQGQSIVLCATPGASGYLWNTGETTDCITISAAGTYSVIVTDANGCSSTCSKSVTDSGSPPVITCPADLTVECDESTLPSNTGTATATDNCNIPPTVDYNDMMVEGACPQEFTITRIWTATSANGTSISCVQVIAVEDTTPPVVSCPAGAMVECGASTLPSDTGIAVAMDNCDLAPNLGFTDLTVGGACPQDFIITRTWTATDACGNSSSCIQIIAVEDTAPPVITCPAGVTVECGASTLPSDTGIAVAIDVCDTAPNLSFTDATVGGACLQEFTIARTWMATDTCGNSSSCIQIIAVEDNTPPIITCPAGAAVQCANQVPAVNIAVVVASDTCGGTPTVTHLGDVTTNQTCANRFTLTRTYLATDDCGNTATCAQVFTVFDSTPPSISCPANATVQCASQATVNTSLVVTSDNCGGTAAVSLVGDIITNQICANRYTLTRTYLATDACGNTATCAQVITVFDSTPPSISCPANATVQCASQVPAANIALVATSDNCGGTAAVSLVGDIITNQICANRYTLTRTYLATDACGNTATCAQVISVFDSTPPSISCPANATVQCASEVPAANIALVAASDNCGGTAAVSLVGDIITNQTCANRYTLTRTYRATDVCGNTATCAQVVTVFDNTPPALIFINPLLVAGDTVSAQCYGQDPTWELPVFDENSVSASDNCTGNVSVAFEQVLENEGNCSEDGYINLHRLVWTATDACGNSSSIFVLLALIDTIPPVIFGVPEDITVNCNDIPAPPALVYATDECLCACLVLLEETVLAPGCQNGQVIVRTWRAKDRCGNETFATQRITLVDEEGPDWQILQAEIAGITDGTILEYTCGEGFPAFLGLLSADFVLDPNSCGGSFVMSFEVDTFISNNCAFFGYVEQRTYSWVGVDECGNLSTLTIFARLIDNEPPVLTGLPDMACIGDTLLNDVDVTDDCEYPVIAFHDVNIPNPCGNGMAVQRIYEAYDDCGNTSRDTVLLIPDGQSLPVIEYVNPVLLDMEFGEVLIVDCAAQNGHYTSFDVDDVLVEDDCLAGVSVTFTETLIETGDCSTDGIVATIELRWTATNVCGNFSELVVIANIVDESSPVFVNFIPEMTIGCNDSLPALIVTDNCGVVSTTTLDSIIPGDCIFEYDMLRIVTATDQCGNTTTLLQTIHVGNGSGPVIDGVVEVICDDISIPEVTAYDSCAGAFVLVAMQEDTLDVPCDGLVIERTWTAVDFCGNVSVVHQTIILNDQTPPEIIVPTYSIINQFLGISYNLIFSWQTDLLFKLSVLDGSSVFIADDCDQGIVPVFTVDTSYADNCIEDGYFERRTYTWTATDACGNSTSISFTVDIKDETPPVFSVVPTDVTIVCAPLPPVPPVFTEDAAQPVTIVFSETTEPGDEPGVFIVTRKWTATDACGNITEYVQRITWIPDTFLECNIILPDVVECNTHGVMISSSYTGGIGPVTYEWEIVGENCFIQGGQGTPKINIYVGWSDAKIILTVTDAFGCVSMCMTTLSCLFSLDNSLPPGTNAVTDSNTDLPTPPAVVRHTSKDNLQQLHLWPNPANQSVNLGFESSAEGEVEFSFMNFLGQVVLNDKISAQEGFNTHKIDVEQIREGSYLMQVKTENETHTKVIVIMRNN